MKYRADIDGLRTIAVVPVLVFHAGLGLPGGFVGVDVFFVISGFLITTILWEEMKAGTYSIVTFYERRIRRIFPALFAVLALTTLVAITVMLPYHLDDYGKSLAGAMLFLSNVWFYLSTSYFNETAEIKPLLHTWSLAIEEQYYVVFPVLLWGLFRFLGRKAIWWVLAALAAVSLVLATWAVGVDPDGAFYLPQYRAWELFVGSLLAIALAEGWIDRPLSRPAVAVPLAAAGLVAIVWSMLAYRPYTPFPGLAALPPCLGAAALIAAGARMQTPVSRLLAAGPMVFIGKISYSLYLWHWPIIVFAFYTNVGELSVLQGIGCLVLSFFFAWGSYLWIEQPVRRNTHGKRPLLFGGGAVAIVAAVGVGGVLSVTDGLPGRLKPESVALLDSSYSHVGADTCHVVTPARAAAGDVCVRGAPDTAPSFMLAGDSHGGALALGFFKAAEEAGLAGYQYTNDGFRPMPGLAKQGEPEWSLQTDAFLAFLEEHPEIRTIYLTAYWQHQVTGSTYRRSGDFWMDEGYDGTGSRYNPVAMANGLNRLAEMFPDREFVLLDDVPSGDMEDPRSAVRAIRFGHADDWSEIGITAEEEAFQRALYEPILTAVAGKHGNVVYRSVFGGMCDDTYCPLFDGMVPRFLDGDHLSPSGSERMVPDLKDKLFSGSDATGG